MTIKIYLKQKGESLKTVILEDVRSVSSDGEFYRLSRLDWRKAAADQRKGART